MAHELVVTVDFFASDYVPQVCLFSGATEGLSPIQISLHFQGWHKKSAFLKPPLAQTFGVWNARFCVPGRRTSRLIWFFWRGVRMAGLVATTVLLLPILCLGVPMLLGSVGPPLPGIMLVWLVGWIVLPTAIWALGVWQVDRRQVHFEPLYASNTVRITFPPNLKPAYDQYATAWKSYDQAGRPQPEHKDRDEGWEDRVKPGWDEEKP
ncbi:MAG TPA: hypothetical protein VL860_11980 [Planctomycetota bacterium]|nr:hypothetical protein [Planctomycetota bacterium]